MQITYSSPFTAGEIMSQFEFNKELLSKTDMTPSVINTPYTPARWLGRILDPDDKNKVNDHHFKSRIVNFHHYYSLEERPENKDPNGSGDMFDKLSRGKVFCIPNVVNRWLSTVFGFFEHNGNIVQINPADLFLYNLYHDFPFDYALRNARVIELPKGKEDSWVIDQLSYYFESFLQYGNYKDEISYWVNREFKLKPNDNGGMYGQESEVLNIPSASFRQNFLVENLENRLLYMKDAKVSRGAILSNLPPLGEVVAFGWSQSIAIDIASLNLMKMQYHRYVKECLEEKGIVPYAQGYWSKKFHPPLKDKSALEFVSQERDKVNKLLSKYHKQSDRVRKTKLIDEVKRLGIYPATTMAKKSWYKDNFLKDAQAMDWVIEEIRDRVFDDDEEKRVTFLVLTKPKTQRRKRG